MQKNQQLTLFGSRVQRGASRRSQKRAKPPKPEASGNLWIEETASEEFRALFFLDIRNFTPLTEKEHARDVIHIIRKLFSTFRTVIRIHHGRIVETTGDGFYAVFGNNREPSQAVSDAVEAGHVILRILEKRNADPLGEPRRHRIEVGIGVHAGEVATGTIALNDRDHVLVMGRAVIIAARIQSATKELNNRFLISSTAFGLLGTKPLDTTPHSLRLKGILEPIDVYAIGKAYT